MEGVPFMQGSECLMQGIPVQGYPMLSGSTPSLLASSFLRANVGDILAAETLLAAPTSSWNFTNTNANNSQSKESPASSTSRKRPIEIEDDDEDEAERSKRHKGPIADVTEDYICPISKELPLDPVIADDGHVYERAKIASYIMNQGDTVKSPLTNERMGSQLRSMSSVRETIENLVKSGGIRGEKARHWIERVEGEKIVTKIREKVRSGDSDAMYELGTCYISGRYGLEQDLSLAFNWQKQGADLGNIMCMAMAGYYLVHGLGTAENKFEGAFLLGRAAQGGSDFAAFAIGELYLDGNHGFPKNIKQGKYWLDKVVSGSCDVKHLTDQGVERARGNL